MAIPDELLKLMQGPQFGLPKAPPAMPTAPAAPQATQGPLIANAPQPAFDTLAAQPLDIAAAAPSPVQVASAPMEGASQFNVPDPVLPEVPQIQPTPQDGRVTSATELADFMAGLNEQAGLPRTQAPSPMPRTPQVMANGTPTSASGIGTSVVNDVNFLQQGMGQAQGMTPQAPTSGLTTQSGIPLSQFLSGEAIPEAGLVAESPMFAEDSVSRGLTGDAGRAAFSQESLARDARQEQMLQERAASRAAARGGDAGGELSMADAVDLAGGDREKARAMVVASRQPQAEEGLTFDQQLALRKQEFAESQTGSAKPSATDQKISLIKEANPNISDADASAIASGSVKVVQNPLTGETQLLNVTTGATQKVGEPQKQGFDFEIEPDKNPLFGRAAKYTGAIEAGKRKAQGLTGQAGLDIATEESLGTAQDFETAQNQLVRAFRDSDRYSATEAKQLKKELNISLSPFEDPKTAEAKLRSIDKSLASRFKEEESTFNDPVSTPKQKQDARMRAKAIATFRSKLGVPEQEPMETGGSEAPEGVDAELWDKYMDEDQRKLWN